MASTKGNHKFRYWLGGFVASLLPVVIGLRLALIPEAAGGAQSCHNHVTDVTFSCAFYRHFGDFYHLFIAPIYMSLIFIAPIIAFTCVRKLLEENDLLWADIFHVSLMQSTKANIWTAVIYNIGILLIFLFSILDVNSITQLTSTIIFIFFTFVIIIIIQFILWLFITIPLSLICASIFGLIIRPSRLGYDRLSKLPN